jgi:hypothetical protein
MNDAWYNYVKGYLPTSSYFGIYDCRTLGYGVAG